jgi:hypothetical protein
MRKNPILKKSKSNPFPIKFRLLLSHYCHGILLRLIILIGEVVGV